MSLLARLRYLRPSRRLAAQNAREAWTWMWIERLAQDLRYGVRMLTKNRAFTAVAVLTLALGIGANTALFSVVKAVLLNSLPYHQPDRLVVLAAGDRETSDPIKVSYGETADWKARSRTLQSIGLYQEWTPTWTGGTSPEIVYGMQITQNFFPTLGVQPAIGRGMLPEEDRPDRGHVVLLSHAYWVSHFAANPKVIGTNILLDQVPFEIAGVLPETFQSLSFNDAGGTPEVWAPLGYDLSMPDACRTWAPSSMRCRTSLLLWPSAESDSMPIFACCAREASSCDRSPNSATAA